MSFIKNLNKTAKEKLLLAPHLDLYYSRGQFPDEIKIIVEPNKERDTAFHPSSHGLACLAATYASMAGLLPPEKHSASTQRVFQIGHALHGLLQNALVDMGFTKPEYIEHEFRRTDDGTVLDCSVDWRTDPKIKEALWWCRGSADVSHCEIPDFGDALVDVKTAASFSFNNVGQDTGFWPKYEAQTQLYMDWHDVDLAIVLYMNKDTPHGFKERHVHRDPDFVESIYERWTIVAEALRAGTPPKCECNPDKACPGRTAIKKAAKA